MTGAARTRTASVGQPLRDRADHWMSVAHDCLRRGRGAALAGDPALASALYSLSESCANLADAYREAARGADRAAASPDTSTSAEAVR